MILPDRVFGRPGAHWIRSGEAIGPISLRTQLRKLLPQLFGWLFAVHQRDIAVDALTLDVVRVADNRGFGDFGMGHKRAFDLGGAHAVARDVDHIINRPVIQ